MDIKIDVNENNANDEYDFYSNKDDLEIGIFRRKISNLDNNNSNEKIKIKIKEVNNYIIFIYIFTLLILFLFIFKIILYDKKNEYNLRNIKYRENSTLQNIFDILESKYLDSNKNDELNYENQHFYYTNKVE
jgi:hypothetical protein